MKKKSTSLQCRKATFQDIPTLLQFEQGVVEAERPFNPDLKDEVKYYDLEKLIQSNDSEVIVAEIEGKIIGSGYVRIDRALPYFRHEFQGYLGFLYIIPDQRGQGCIQVIMEELKQWVKSKGIKQLYLEVYAENKGAVKAYEKFGFRQQIVGMNMDI